MAQPEKAKKPKGTTAFHAKAKDGKTNVVGVNSLRVLIVEDSGSWFAQGLEIDYSAQGTSLENVQKIFAEGLKRTIRQHIKHYGDIEKMLQIAPMEAWEPYLKNAGRWTFSSVSTHFIEQQDVDLQKHFGFADIAFLTNPQTNQRELQLA